MSIISDFSRAEYDFLTRLSKSAPPKLPSAEEKEEEEKEEPNDEEGEDDDKAPPGKKSSKKGNAGASKGGTDKASAKTGLKAFQKKHAAVLGRLKSARKTAKAPKNRKTLKAAADQVQRELGKNRFDKANKLAKSLDAVIDRVEGSEMTWAELQKQAKELTGRVAKVASQLSPKKKSAVKKALAALERRAQRVDAVAFNKAANVIFRLILPIEFPE